MNRLNSAVILCSTNILNWFRFDGVHGDLHIWFFVPLTILFFCNNILGIFHILLKYSICVLVLNSIAPETDSFVSYENCLWLCFNSSRSILYGAFWNFKSNSTAPNFNSYETDWAFSSERCILYVHSYHEHNRFGRRIVSYIWGWNWNFWLKILPYQEDQPKWLINLQIVWRWQSQQFRIDLNQHSIA